MPFFRIFAITMSSTLMLQATRVACPVMSWPVLPRCDGDYRTTLESLISLASRAAELFERSKPGQKRGLIAFVFSNLA
jgi:hypothetical protein